MQHGFRMLRNRLRRARWHGTLLSDFPRERVFHVPHPHPVSHLQSLRIFVFGFNKARDPHEVLPQVIVSNDTRQAVQEILCPEMAASIAWPVVAPIQRYQVRIEVNVASDSAGQIIPLPGRLFTSRLTRLVQYAFFTCRTNHVGMTIRGKET